MEPLPRKTDGSRGFLPSGERVCFGNQVAVQLEHRRTQRSKTTHSVASRCKMCDKRLLEFNQKMKGLVQKFLCSHRWPGCLCLGLVTNTTGTRHQQGYPSHLRSTNFNASDYLTLQLSGSAYSRRPLTLAQQRKNMFG